MARTGYARVSPRSQHEDSQLHGPATSWVRYVVLATVLVLGSAGCTGDLGRDPGRSGVRQVMLAWARAYADGDGDTACDLMTKEGRDLALTRAGNLPTDYPTSDCAGQLSNPGQIPTLRRSQQDALRSLTVPIRAITLHGSTSAEIHWSAMAPRRGRLKCDPYACAGPVGFAREHGRWRISDMYLP